MIGGWNYNEFRSIRDTHELPDEGNPVLRQIGLHRLLKPIRHHAPPPADNIYSVGSSAIQDSWRHGVADLYYEVVLPPESPQLCSKAAVLSMTGQAGPPDRKDAGRK